MYSRHYGIIAVAQRYLEQQVGMKKATIDYYKSRGQCVNANGRSCRNNPAEIAIESIPSKWKAKMVEVLGDPYEMTGAQDNLLQRRIMPDPAAAAFYGGYDLTPAKQLLYRTTAEILNAVIAMVDEQLEARRSVGGKTYGIWPQMAAKVAALDKGNYPHRLPANAKKLSMKAQQYKEGGYAVLVHGLVGNNNSRKVDVQLERLILALYTLPEKPYTTTVKELFDLFMGGEIDVYDTKGGELFAPADFVTKNGQPVTVSEGTCWRYINKPGNRAVVDKYRMSPMAWQAEHRPHHHRDKPMYGLSKVSLDDRDLPRKMPDGNRVKAYYAYDVASGAVIGASYSKTKDTTLFIDCLRDMFRSLAAWGLGTPLEMEVEHHLVNNYRDDLMQAGIVFPFVRWCNPGNSQEKHAEHFNRAKKYGYEKRYQTGIGRFYSRLEANKTHSEKVFDEHNNTYKEATYSYEQLVADDREIIALYNNAKHPDKKYKGMSRMEVLRQHANPAMAQMDNALLARYIGEQVETTVQRNQYVQVQYNKYLLDGGISAIDKLSANNYTVQAYYVPTPGGEIGRVYLYQHDRFICEAAKVVKYNTATAEQGDGDEAAYTQQAAVVSAFDTEIKRRTAALGKIRTSKVKHSTVPVEAEVAEEVPVEDMYNDSCDAGEDAAAKAFNDF